MTCPTCQESIGVTSRNCPACGSLVARMQTGMIKMSAVLVASANGRVMYPSLRAIPEPLRRRVVECTNGRNSGTVVIADRRGQEQIERMGRLAYKRERCAPVRMDRKRRVRQYLWIALASLLTAGAGAGLLFLPH